MKALAIDNDSKAYSLAVELKEPAFTMLVSKMKVQSAKSPNESIWPLTIGSMYEQNKQYEKAIDYYNIANGKDVSSLLYQRISSCQFYLGDYDAALYSINQALNLDSTDMSFQAFKALLFLAMGNYEAAILEWDKVLSAQPEYGLGYCYRGWVKDLSGDMDGAFEDLSMAVVLDPKNSFAFARRGEVYVKQGKKELAEADFKKVIELEDSPEKYYSIHCAYYGLGQYDKAISAMDTIIARDSTNSENLYDAACLYSRMQDKETALKYLEKSFQLGYKGFALIELDVDLDFLRDSEEFNALFTKYKSEHESNLKNKKSSKLSNETITTEVPFVKEDGVCKVKCKINDLPLHFVFDTGASDVTLSMVEATFMMKNGYLTGNDVVGSQRYMDANGDVSVGTVINLKNVNFGGLELNNVRASVVRNQKAPLLLGQSVLARLGKIEIDNSKHVLKITHHK